MPLTQKMKMKKKKKNRGDLFNHQAALPTQPRLKKPAKTLFFFFFFFFFFSAPYKICSCPPNLFHDSGFHCHLGLKYPKHFLCHHCTPDTHDTTCDFCCLFLETSWCICGLFYSHLAESCCIHVEKPSQAKNKLFPFLCQKEPTSLKDK